MGFTSSAEMRTVGHLVAVHSFISKDVELVLTKLVDKVSMSAERSGRYVNNLELFFGKTPNDLTLKVFEKGELWNRNKTRIVTSFTLTGTRLKLIETHAYSDDIYSTGVTFKMKQNKDLLFSDL